MRQLKLELDDLEAEAAGAERLRGQLEETLEQQHIGSNGREPAPVTN